MISYSAFSQIACKYPSKRKWNVHADTQSAIVPFTVHWLSSVDNWFINA